MRRLFFMALLFLGSACNNNITIHHSGPNSSAIMREWQSTLPLEFQSSVPLINVVPSNLSISMNATGEAIISWQAISGIYIAEYKNGSWSKPFKISDAFSINASDPKVALSDNGEAVVVWTEYSNFGSGDVFFSEYRLSTNKWSQPASINFRGELNGVYNPTVAMNASGDTIVVWTQYDGTNDQIFKAENQSGIWTKPSGIADNISPDGQSAMDPAVALADNGDALIVWNQSDGVTQQIFKSEKRSGAWVHPANLADNISPDGQSATISKAAMNATGDAVITWEQSDGANQQIFKSEYRTGVWVHPAALNDNISPDGQFATNSKVAMSATGDAVITWVQSDGAFYQTFKSEYRSGAWIHPAALSDNISPDGQHADFPVVSMNNAGDTIISWSQSDGTNDQIFKSEFESGSWTHPSSLVDNISPDLETAYYPVLDMSAGSDALIIWNQSSPSGQAIFKSEKRAGIWQHPVDANDHLLSLSFQGLVNSVDVAINALGDAVVVWTSFNGATTDIFKSEYRNGAWTHPIDSTDTVSFAGTNAAAPAVDMNDSGETIITWGQRSGTEDHIFKSEYRNGSWSYPANINDHISFVGQSAFNPKVVINSSGEALIVWGQSDGANYQIFKSEYRSGAWVHPSSLADNISPGSSFAAGVDVDISNNGEAVIVWGQKNGALYQIYKSEYRAGSWVHPSGLGDFISPIGDGNSLSAKVGMTKTGETFIVWAQTDGAFVQVFKSHYQSGSWTHPASAADNMSPDGKDIWDYDLSVSPNGDALVAWTTQSFLSSEIYKAHYHQGNWTIPSSSADHISQIEQEIEELTISVGDDFATIMWLENASLIRGYEFKNSSWSFVTFDQEAGAQRQAVECNINNECIYISVDRNGSTLSTGLNYKLRE